MSKLIASKRLDIIVATKLMGWREDSRKPWDGDSVALIDPETNQFCEPPHYSTNLLDAMRIVPKLVHYGDRFELTFSRHGEDPKWWANFELHRPNPHRMESFWSDGETQCLAVIGAALKTLSENKEIES